MTDPAPIEKRVTRYICPFCHRGRSTYRQISSHMAWCLRNPAAKRCLTCANFCPAEELYLESYAPRDCAEGVDISSNGLPHSCELWSAT